MSRIGKKPVTLPKGVVVTVTGSEAFVEGAKGKLSCPIPKGITLDIQADSVVLSRVNDEPQNRAFHGLTRALLGNAVTGVTEGWKKELDIVGVGYKAAMDGAKLKLELGYSHPINYEAPAGITMAVEKTTHIVVTGIWWARSPPTSGSSASPSRTRARASCTPAKSSAARPARPGSKGNPWRTISTFDATRPRPASAAA